MPTLPLTACFVNLVATGAYVSGLTAQGRSRAHGVAGDVQTFAGGRQRAVVTVGEISVVPLRMRVLNLLAVETLRAWAGLSVEFRDTFGLQMYGVFFEVEIINYIEPAIYDIEFEVRATTFVEGV